jgi:hypothetical protein
VGIDTESAENFLVAGENVAESGERASGGFCEREAASAAASAFAERSRLKNKDGPLRSQSAQPGRRGKAREATADNGEIHMVREGPRGGTEIDDPRRRAPGMGFAWHGNSWMQTECEGCVAQRKKWASNLDVTVARRILSNALTEAGVPAKGARTYQELEGTKTFYKRSQRDFSLRSK